MIKHGKKIIVTVGAVTALAFGGATLANAGTTPAKSTGQPAVEQTSGPDLDKIQSGDQTTPDLQSASSVSSASSESASSPEAPGVEAPAASETAGEAPGSETATANDGPGGHADEPGNANADQQFEGVQ